MNDPKNTGRVELSASMVSSLAFREAEATPAELLHDKLADLIEEFRAARQLCLNDVELGEFARQYSIIITELEGALARLQYFILLEE